MSESIEHGISIGISSVKNNFFIKLKITGTLTHDDYELMVPMIENALQDISEPKITILIDALEFNGWELHAMWDDLKFGFNHANEFTKIAFVGNKKWEEYAIKISSWFMIGDLEYFENMNDAIIWVNTQKPQLDVVQKELLNREDKIKKSLENLFKQNMKITDWNIPEGSRDIG